MKILATITVLLSLIIAPIITSCGEDGDSDSDSGGLTTNEIVYNPPTENVKYSYYYFIPVSALERNPVRIMFLGHGNPNATYDELELDVQHMINSFSPYAQQYRYALLSMVIPGNAGPDCYFSSPQGMTEFMFDDVLNTEECSLYYRIDLEYRKVIDNFLSLLESYGHVPYQKVFMTGFSNGGLQTNRLTFLHTDLIAAAAIGAAGLYTYPIDNWNGTVMDYPIGTADIDSLTSMYSFNFLKLIPHFIFVGENDTIAINDPIGSLPGNIEFYKDNFGSNQTLRVPIYSDYLVSIGMQSEYKIYSDKGHEYTNEMIRDTLLFFESVVIN